MQTTADFQSNDIVEVVAITKREKNPPQCAWEEHVLYEQIITGQCHFAAAWMSPTVYRMCPQYDVRAMDSDGDGKPELFLTVRQSGRQPSGYPLRISHEQITQRLRPQSAK